MTVVVLVNIKNKLSWLTILLNFQQHKDLMLRYCIVLFVLIL